MFRNLRGSSFENILRSDNADALYICKRKGCRKVIRAEEREHMQENDQLSGAWTGCYKIEYLNEESEVAQEELFDTVFSKLEKIQRQVMLKRIKKAEAQLTSLEKELTFFFISDEQ